MTEDLAYTIPEKIDYANEMLEKKGTDGPRVSLSAGVAFSQRTDPTGTLFEDADQALYERKKHGKSGCSFSKKAE